MMRKAPGRAMKQGIGQSRIPHETNGERDGTAWASNENDKAKHGTRRDKRDGETRRPGKTRNETITENRMRRQEHRTDEVSKQARNETNDETRNETTR